MRCWTHFSTSMRALAPVGLALRLRCRAPGLSAAAGLVQSPSPGQAQAELLLTCLATVPQHSCPAATLKARMQALCNVICEVQGKTLHVLTWTAAAAAGSAQQRHVSCWRTSASRTQCPLLRSPAATAGAVLPGTGGRVWGLPLPGVGLRNAGVPAWHKDLVAGDMVLCSLCTTRFQAKKVAMVQQAHVLFNSIATSPGRAEVTLAELRVRTMPPQASRMPCPAVRRMCLRPKSFALLAPKPSP